MLHAVVDENMPDVESILGHGARVTRVNGRGMNQRHLRDADVLFVRSITAVNSALLADSPVRFVGTATSGMEHVDTDFLQQRGIGFCRAAGANANSVVEYVIAALVAFPDRLQRLMAGGRAGVIGQGPVGKAVAERLRALGGECLVYDPWLPEEKLTGAAPLPEVLSCDLVCLHPELTRRQPWPSYHMVAGAELAAMDGRQLLINASRGAVVDNAALLLRLEQAGPPQVVLDVWEGEPELDIRLLRAVDIGTAHIAGYSLDSKILATRMLCAAMAAELGYALPEPDALQHGVPVYRATGQLHGPELVSHLMGQCYDIQADDRRLREACAAAVSPGSAFDGLRRDYPERRELAGHTVLGTTDLQRETVHALGCITG